MKRVALSLGDPGGIGPELVAYLSHDQELLSQVQVICFGDLSTLLKAAALQSETLRVEETRSPQHGMMGFVQVGPALSVVFGQENSGAGRAQLSYVDAALQAVLQKEADALCTAPVTKALIDKEVGSFTGHTGYLGRKLSATPLMLLASEELRVLLLTEHIPLRSVAEKLSIQRIQETLQIAVEGLRRDLGIAVPRIAVAALNPHAGEGGLLGHEEQSIIGPAVEAASRYFGAAAQIFGPLAADSMFTASMRSRYDAALCLYHDQGLIPLKALSARSAVNISLGLPIVRTSPDHGTAYDIAGKNLADAGSLKRAILLAAEMAARR
jgi:4-hydroxythreonine-4-phosphate dehydrogenase